MTETMFHVEQCEYSGLCLDRTTSKGEAVFHVKHSREAAVPAPVVPDTALSLQ